MEIKLAESAGFCFGVKRAIDKVYEQIETGKTIYTYGPIIHNEEVVKDLEAKGVRVIDHFEYIVTNTETEAFVLELNLIKKYDPKYNILLRDDKSYPYIELTNEKYPRLIVKREINANKRKSNYFGPYPNQYAARRLVNLLNRLYPLKKCDSMPKKVCLYYHIGECLGYCENKNIDTTNLKL